MAIALGTIYGDVRLRLSGLQEDMAAVRASMEQGGAAVTGLADTIQRAGLALAGLGEQAARLGASVEGLGAQMTAAASEGGALGAAAERSAPALAAQAAAANEAASALTRTAEAEGLAGSEAQAAGAKAGIFKGVMGGLGGVMGGFLGLFAVVSLFQLVGGAINKGITAADGADHALAQLDAVLKSTGGAAGVTKTQALDLAASLSRVTEYTKTSVLGAENLLLTFTSIGKDVMPLATQSVLDMSTALHEDLKSAAIQVGKALQDPVLGATALRRVGVNFSKEQIAVFKQMVASGHLAEAQKAILKELQNEFGKSAEAAGKTFGGQLVILTNQLKALGTSLGRAVMPLLEGLLKLLIPLAQWLADGVTTAFAAVQRESMRLGNSMGVLHPLVVLVGDGLRFVGRVLGEALGVVKTFATYTLNGLSPALKRAAIDVQTLADLAIKPLASLLKGPANGATQLFSGAITHLQGPMDGIVSTVSGLVYKLDIASGNFTRFSGIAGHTANSVAPAFHVMAAKVGGVLDLVKVHVLGLAQTFLGQMAPALHDALPGFQQLAGAIQQAAPQLLHIGLILATGLVPVFQTLVPVVAAMAPAILRLAGAIAGTLGTTITAILPSISDLLSSLSGAFADISTAAAGLAPVVAGLVPPLASLAAGLGKTFAVVVKAVAPAISTLLRGLGSLGAQAVGLIRPLIAFIRTTLLPTIQGLLPHFQGLAKAIGGALNVIVPILLVLGHILLDVVGFALVNVVLPALGFLVPIIGGVITTVLDLTTGFFNLITTVVNFGGLIVSIIGGALGWIGNLADAILGVLQPAFSVIGTVVQTFGTVIQALGTVVGTVFGTMLDVVLAPFRGLIAIVNTAIGLIDNIHVSIPDWVPFIGGQTWGLSIPTLPTFAQGGIMGRPGAAIVGERGPEIVVMPAGANVIRNDATQSLLAHLAERGAPNGGGATITITNHVTVQAQRGDGSPASVGKAFGDALGDHLATKLRQRGH